VGSSRPRLGLSAQHKYRLAFVVNGVCRVRYDNERGKGDHRHLDGKESAYAFRGLERLLADFWRDVNKRR
jgi:hypothetical protein